MQVQGFHVPVGFDEAADDGIAAAQDKWCGNHGEQDGCGGRLFQFGRNHIDFAGNGQHHKAELTALRQIKRTLEAVAHRVFHAQSDDENDQCFQDQQDDQQNQDLLPIADQRLNIQLHADGDEEEAE